jgi:succinate-semialdehyde dehydrogenase/glutarate-semialdehyde dehydrogenase
MIEAINPTTGKHIRRFDAMRPQDIMIAIDAGHRGFQEWRRTDPGVRGELMRAVAEVLRGKKAEYSALMAEEMGKPLKEGKAEVEKCAWVCDYYADNGANFLRDEEIKSDAGKSYITFQPLGVVLAVMPWNFPFWQVFRFAAPGLMAGNAGLLKHSSSVPGCALAIQDAFRAAGFPQSVFQTLLIGSEMVDIVIDHPFVKAVTLTGSTPAGSAVARKSGEVLKKTVLELGGSDPYIILADANMEKAVNSCVTSRLINAGQSCIAAKRFVVVDQIREVFERRVVAEMGARIMGDPFVENTDYGPLARHDLRDQLHEQVRESVAAGAKCLLGGYVPKGEGAFYPATVLTNVGRGMPAYSEELFGPVAAIISVRDADEAIRVANDSNFGLGAAVFTEDIARGEAIASQFLEAGSCFVNAFVKSDPRLPFGGIAESGYGRELSHYGIREFVNIKTVYIA